MMIFKSMTPHFEGDYNYCRSEPLGTLFQPCDLCKLNYKSLSFVNANTSSRITSTYGADWNCRLPRCCVPNTCMIFLCPMHEALATANRGQNTHAVLRAMREALATVKNCGTIFNAASQNRTLVILARRGRRFCCVTSYHDLSNALA